MVLTMFIFHNFLLYCDHDAYFFACRILVHKSLFGNNSLNKP